MMMKNQIAAYPEWSPRAHVEAWLKDVAKEAGEYAENAMAEFGCAAPDHNGEIDTSHLPDADIDAIMQAAISA